jgi:hypothetical protein
MLKVSRKRRRDAADDDAELFDDWSHEVRLEISNRVAPHLPEG